MRAAPYSPIDPAVLAGPGGAHISPPEIFIARSLGCVELHRNFSFAQMCATKL